MSNNFFTPSDYKDSADHAWATQIYHILNKGSRTSPRGMGTLELLHSSLCVDMRQCVVTNPKRKLSYKFMSAEAFWILTGDDSVEGIAPWCKKIADFSDDGEIFFGAYGPPILNQLQYVCETLLRDRDSRQAGLTIWRQNPPQSKDIPCTVSMWFYVRDNVLHSSVYMRSSDVWLGLPYDIFNFSMIAHLVCAFLNTRGERLTTPGALHITMGSSHLYDRNRQRAEACCQRAKARNILYKDMTPTPVSLFMEEYDLTNKLSFLRDRPEKGWWKDDHENWD